MSGLSADEVDPRLADLALIAEGGENFAARLTALKNQQKASEQALADLHLGVDIKRGFDEAKARLEAADAALAQAQTRAQNIEAVARSAADTLISAAREQLAAAEADGRRYLVNAQEHADDLLRDAQMKQADATRLRDEALAMEQQARAARDETQRQAVEQRQAIADLDHLRTEVAQKRNLLLEAIRRTG